MVKNTSGKNNKRNRHRALHVSNSYKCSVTRKHKYAERKARQMVGELKQSSRQEMKAYECRHCNHWHIGREKNENRESRYIPGIGRVSVRHFA